MTRIKISDFAVDNDGEVVAGAQVAIRRAFDNALATLYTTEGGATTKSNPFNAGDGDPDDAGYFEAWLAPGIYDVTVGADPFESTKRVFAFRGKPIVILADGQSNIRNPREYDWNPQPNLFALFFEGNAETGTMQHCPSDEMRFAWAFADEIAKENPTSAVFVVSSGKGGEPISAWLPDVADGETDMYALTKSRLEDALDQIGLTEIDMVLWWQGESDSGSSALRNAYSANFDALVARWQEETWFPANCPIRICGVVSTAVNGDSDYRNMNITLQKVAWAPNRSFFQSHKALTGAAGGDDWLDVLHPTGLGYEKVGRANARDFLHPTGAYVDGMAYDPENGWWGFGDETDAGVDWDFRRDLDRDVTQRVINLGTGNDARAVHIIANSYGTFQARAWGNSASGRFEQNWSGLAAYQIKAPNALAGITLFAGKSTETARLNDEIFRVTLAATPADNNLGDSAEMFVTQNEAGFRVPVNLAEPFWLTGGAVRTVANLVANDPDAEELPGAIVRVSDATPSNRLAYSDGTAWRYVSDDTVIS